jgi:hypothetical protein
MFLVDMKENLMLAIRYLDGETGGLSVKLKMLGVTHLAVVLGFIDSGVPLMPKASMELGSHVGDYLQIVNDYKNNKGV